MTLTRPVLRWHGGKWRVGPWIIDQFPDHSAYVEPFGGGASVLLRKPRSRLEIYNDLGGDVVNLFRVLRDRPSDLVHLVALTPFSRDDFEAAYLPADDPVRRAANMLIRSHMGFGSNAHQRKSGFRAAGRRAGSLPAHQWAGLPEVVGAVAERLRGVVIENRPAVDVITANDEDDALFYIDPPYMPETRDRGRDYSHEMTRADHVDLLAKLKSVQGRVVLSGYASELYDAELAGWRRIERATFGDGAVKRTEVLWMNYEPSPLLRAMEENQ